ncbi:MAG: SMEK domain-containing protein [Acetatifactor sp.]|nr:SMEK domain-containing protein [Acetatifactor sp.]
MNRIKLCNEIETYFVRLKMQIQSYNQQNMYDINIYCENLFLNLLNLTYGWHLENLNVEYRNEPGADLVDYDNKILIQVSSTCTKEKIQFSIDKLIREKYDGFHFKFLSILKDAQKLKKFSYNCSNGISFQPYKDIFDLNILIKKIKESDIEKLWKIYEMVKRELDSHYEKRFSLTWFKRKVTENVKNMGERYSEELDVEWEMYDTVNAMERNSHFKNTFQREFEKLEISWKNLKQKGEHEKQIYCEADSIFKEMRNSVNKLVNGLRHEKIKDFLVKYMELNVELKKCFKKSDYKPLYESFGFMSNLKNYDNYLASENIDIFQKKNVLIIGSAGIGKSHFMAHHALRRANEDKVSLLLLGHLFRDRIHPDLQIKKQLGLSENTDIDEVFGAMNQWGEEHNENAIVFLDALNEGEGVDFWEDYLYGMIEELREYPYVSLVLSIRSTYCKANMMKRIAEENDFAKIEFGGFTDVNKAVAQFFAYYNVPYTINTSIMAQYRNPLFLKIYCKSYAEESRNDCGLESILQRYFEKINSDIRKKQEMAWFPQSQNIVAFALDIFIDCRIEKRHSMVQYKEVLERMLPLLKKYNISFNILDELISENLLECITDEEGSFVYLAYEMFENYLVAQRIVKESIKRINNYGKLDCEELVREVFSKESKYHKLIRKDYGVLEALAVILPDLDMALDSAACEVFYWPENYGDGCCNRLGLYEDAFYESMLWRKPERIKKIAHSYVINDCFVGITGNPWAFDRFFEIILQTAIVKNHIYNADFLNNFLMTFSLNALNRYWTSYISHKFHENLTFRMLLDWAWNYETNGLAENAFATQALADVFAWFLASLNHNVRDIAIKALMRIYRRNHDIINKHLIMFRPVKDMYILEGIMASIYGAMLNSKDTSLFCETGEILYDKYAKIPVNSILTRSYVECIFSYLAFQKIESKRITFDKISCNVNKYYIIDEAEIDRIRNNYIPDFECIRELETWGIDYNEFQEEMLYEHDKLIRNLEKDVKDIEIEESEKEYFYTAEIIDRVPYEDRINMIHMVIKEVFDMGYNELVFMDRDLYCSDTDEDSIAYKYVWIALGKVLDIYLSYKKQILHFNSKRPISFQGIWQIPFYRWIDPTMDFFSCFETKSTNSTEYKLADIMKNIENIFYAEDKEDSEGQWISINNIIYSDMESKTRTAVGYLVSNQKINEFQSILEDARHDPFLYGLEDLYIRELYWSPAYQYIQQEAREKSGLPDGIERVSEEYVWDIGDGSMHAFISFSVISQYIIRELDLDKEAGSMKLYKNGSVVVKSIYEETYANILYIQKHILSDFLKKEGKCVLWPFYESEGKLVYVIFDGENFSIIIPSEQI